MTIICQCDFIVRDQTDFLPHKAYFTADMDLDDFWQVIATAFEDLAGALRSTATDEASVRAAIRKVQEQAEDASLRYRRLMYQCPGCGRLYIDDTKGVPHVFEPSNAEASAHLLRSVEGEKWKGFLRGYWDGRTAGEPRRELRWQAGADSKCVLTSFDDFPSLLDKYFEVLQSLHEREILRWACLAKDGKSIHEWPRDGLTRVDPAAPHQ